MALSLSLNIKNKTLTNKVNQAIDNMKKEAQKYIDENDFKNVQPKVGYLEEKTYPIYATYNMSYTLCNSDPSWSISDAAGRELVYVSASDGKSNTPMKIYRAYRFNSNEEYTFENTDIRPAYLNKDIYVKKIIGLGCEWIAYLCSDDKYHLVITNGQSYDKWSNYKDITSIMKGDEHNILYFAETGTIGSFCLNGLARNLRIYKYTDLSLVATVLLFDGTIAAGGYKNMSSTDNRRYGTLIYNKSQKQLIMVTGYLTWLEKAKYVAYKVVNAWTVDTKFLETGVGQYDSLFSNADIFVNGGSAVYPNIEDAIRGCYDEYEQVIRYTNKQQDQYYEYIHKKSALSPQADSNFFGNGASAFFATPDACPWAKRIRPPIYAMEGNLYFNADSKTYGGSHIYVDHYNTYDKDGYLNLIPGRWWRSDGLESSVFSADNIRLIQCQRINSKETRWQAVLDWGSDIKNVTFGKTTRDGITMDGFRTLSDAIKTFPTLPPTYIKIAAYPYYDNNKDTAIGIVAKPVDGDWPKLILLEYDFKTQVWTEYDTMPQEIKNELNAQKNRLQDFNGGYILSYSNMFIDTDSTAYVSLRFEMGGWADAYTLVIAPDKTVSLMSSLGAYCGSKSIGYDPVFGYYRCSQDGGFSFDMMYHTRDITGAGADKSLSDFKNGPLYSTKVGPKSAVGLIAYTQKTPMLVNGKCKSMGSTGVTLFPNTTNYIFVIGENDAFKLEARTSDTLSGGESKFNTVLIAKIITNGSDPLSIEYYEI